MNLLIIGLGSIGKKHVAAIRHIDKDVQIFALRHDPASVKYDSIININDLIELKQVQIDFIIISNPTAHHKSTLEQVIDYQIPLFIEKPLHSSLDIIEIINKIEEKNILTYVACNLRFLESIIFIREHLAKNTFGLLNEVNAYCGSYLPDWRPNSDYKTSYSAIPALGGGVHFDLIHELDYIYWLFGSPLKANRTFSHKSTLSIEAYDYANYLLEFKSFNANVILNYFRRDSKRSLELVFEEKTLYVDLLKNQVQSEGEILFQSNQRIIDTYLYQMNYFLDCIHNKKESMNTVIDAYNVLKICIDQ